MSAAQHESLVSLLHHWVLGGIWALGGLACVADAHRSYWWERSPSWLMPILVGAAYVAAGIGFVLGRTWARVLLGVLMVVAALIFCWCIFMAGWVGNRPLLHWMLVALGIAIYTGAFISFSAIVRWTRNSRTSGGNTIEVWEYKSRRCLRNRTCCNPSRRSSSPPFTTIWTGTPHIGITIPARIIM